MCGDVRMDRYLRFNIPNAKLFPFVSHLVMKFTQEEIFIHTQLREKFLLTVIYAAKSIM